MLRKVGGSKICIVFDCDRAQISEILPRCDLSAPLRPGETWCGHQLTGLARGAVEAHGPGPLLPQDRLLVKVGEPVSWEVAEHRRRVTCAVERALRERAQREHALRMRRGKVLTHKISLLKLFEVASKNVAAVEVDHMDVDHARPLPASFHVNGCVPPRAFAEALLLDAEARRRRELFHRLFDRTFFLKFLSVVRAAALGGFDAGGTGGGLRAALSAVQLGVGFSSNDEGDGPQSALSVLAPLAFALAAVVVLQEKSRRRAKARGANAKKRAAKAEERLAEAEAWPQCPLAAMACSPAAGRSVPSTKCLASRAPPRRLDPYGGTAADMDASSRGIRRCFLFSGHAVSTSSGAATSASPCRAAASRRSRPPPCRSSAATRRGAGRAASSSLPSSTAASPRSSG